jgi:hypothetical protein
MLAGSLAEAGDQGKRKVAFSPERRTGPLPGPREPRSGPLVQGEGRSGPGPAGPGGRRAAGARTGPGGRIWRRRSRMPAAGELNPYLMGPAGEQAHGHRLPLGPETRGAISQAAALPEPAWTRSRPGFPVFSRRSSSSTGPLSGHCPSTQAR